MSGVEACYIRLQRDRVKKQQRRIVDQLITKSRYVDMDRNERRTFEYYADEIAQLKAQKKDLAKAEVVAERIGVILERLRKELNAIMQHLSDYNFASTRGSDTQNVAYEASSAVCDTNGDLTADGATRHHWIERAKQMIVCLRNFSLAQRLGNYSLGFDATETGFVSVIDGGTATTSTCPDVTLACLIYRPEFLYMQQVTSCRTVTKLQEDEQDIVDNDVDEMNPVDPAHEGPYRNTPYQDTHNYFKVTNCNLQIHALWRDLVLGVKEDGSPQPSHLSMIDDERDVTCIIQTIQAKLDDVMECQQDNDNEQASLQCASEVNAQNLCWFESVAAEVNEIDEDELKSKHANGEAILGDLNDLFKKASSKKNYFTPNELCSTGSSWG